MNFAPLNLVGYAQGGLKSGYSLVSPQFLNIGTDGIALESLVAVGDGVSDAVEIQTLDKYGYTVDSYVWNDWASENPCWVDDSYTPVEGVTFAPGQGLWVGGDTSEQAIQSAGKVGDHEIAVKLRSGYTLAGNPFPVAVDLQDILAIGEGTSDTVEIQTLDKYGYTVDSYVWNDWAAEKPCWVDDSYTPVEGVTFAPGQGLWVGGDTDQQYIQFPAPEL